MICCTPRRRSFNAQGACLWLALLVLFVSQLAAAAQPVDCRALAARIAALGDGAQKYSRQYGAAAQKQRAELDRAIRNARALGCDRGQFPFFGAPDQCQGLNAQIEQLQANLAHYDRPGDAERQQLTASYNYYCRSQAQPSNQPQPHGFFETLFGALNLNPNGTPFGQPPGQGPPPVQALPPDGGEVRPRGGSQALCVRSCDGGFFPLSISARQAEPDELANLCQALCPNAEVSVYTRAPNQDITSAVSLDGETAYADSPNALKFQKTYDSACTCKPPGQSWAEALSGAEQILGHVRKSDILVTPESSDAMARPKSAAPPPGPTRTGSPEGAAGNHADGSAANAKGNERPGADMPGPDGVKRHVRIIVPPL